jgi:HEAT repeat protein
MVDSLAPYADIVQLLRQWENDLQSREASQIEHLRQYDETVLAEAMSAILVHADDDIRLTAIDILPEIFSQDQLIDLLLPCLSDPRSGIRWTICKLFQRYHDLRVIPAVIDVLRNDENPHVRVVAVDVLCELGDASAIPALLEAIKFDTGRNYDGRTVADAAREAVASIEERMKISSSKQID